ncbi:DUF397 domain-containing protein [Kitasatospora brasiliensis]|uniref:DUF397 domain-containing protein n=1 Tax=Kitasatospora brasiliensis TaxID=3058040 RepID=UPI00292D10CB|nr:DUF397 domain-containing protein [Kitasatospora sp. K002]
MHPLLWRKSSFSGFNEGGNCVELAATADGHRYLRESDDPSVVITTTTASLHALLLGAKAGDFDHLT